jgi:hypothetical protein
MTHDRRPIPAEAAEQIAAAIEAAVGDPGMTAAGPLTARAQETARRDAGIVRSWPASGVEADLTDVVTREEARAAGRPHRIDLAATRGEGGPHEHLALRLAALDAGGVDDVTELAVSGEVTALIVPAHPAPEPVAGQVTMLTFAVTTALPRAAALDRRDDIIRHLRALGIRLSVTHGTDSALADAGTPTFGDVVTGQAAAGVVRGVENAAGDADFFCRDPQPSSRHRIVNRAGRNVTGAQPSDYPLTGTCHVCLQPITCADGTADWTHRVGAR